MGIKLVGILEQLRIALFKKESYPSVRLFSYWESSVSKNGKTVYKQWKTLYNYLTNKKTVHGESSYK